MSKPQQAPVHQGPLGWVRKGAVEVRHFVLRPESLDYYASKEEADKGGPVSGRLLLDDIEELDLTETGFKFGLPGNRIMELKVTEEGHLKKWMDALTPFFENDSDDEEAQADEVEEEVVHDSPLVVEIQGKRQQKHFWLFNDRLEYTNTEDDQVPEDSFALERISVKILSTGFELSTPNRRIVLYCNKQESKEWILNLQQAYESHARANNPNSPRKTLPVSSSASVPPPPSPPNALNSTTSPTAPTPSAGSVSSPSTTKANDAPPAPRIPRHQGELGVFQRGSEESRYFVLFDESLEYWSAEGDYLRGDRARGYVVNTSVINLEVADKGWTFTIFLDSMNRLELRCKTAQILDTWLDQWSSILGKTISRVAEEPPSRGQERTAKSPESPMQNQSTVPPKVGIIKPTESPRPQPAPVGSTIRLNLASPTSPSQPAPSSPPSKLNATPASPGYASSQQIFMGSLVINSGGKLRRRHFALFDNRLDYFATAGDVTGDRYPRGRILLRDITALDVLDNGFQLNFSNNLDVTKMVLIAEPGQLQLWTTAWTKTSLLRGDGQQSAMLTASTNRPQSPRPPGSPRSPRGKLQDALIQGQLGMLRQHNTGKQLGGGMLKPEARYFVLFPDRLDCFIDEQNATKGRTLESLLRVDIQDIDVVQDGFNIASIHRAGRPLRLRALPGVQPSTEQWIAAFKTAFSG